MQILKPPWVQHQSQPIYAIDILPDGSRLATGGQGDGIYGMLRIWNMDPIRSEPLELDKKCPRLMCSLESHQRCVNCVRWSNDGTFLASAGEDDLVIIWCKTASSNAVFGSKNVNIEHWKNMFILRGHTAGVLHVAWSVGDVYLASCSVDNSVIIWNSCKFPEIVTKLTGHTSFVKGVAWDPIGLYIASQSDDKTLKVWRTRDWREEATISKPFIECSNTTQFLRCDWSTDGQFIVSANAKNCEGPVSQIINRKNFIAHRDLVGHRKAVTCVRFHPKLFRKDSTNFVIFATGSNDRSLSIWASIYVRPIIVIHDIFEAPITDVVWCKNSLECAACSKDGTVVFLEFSEDEIGTFLTDAEHEQGMKKLYGHMSFQIGVHNIIENPDILKFQKLAQEQQRTQLLSASIQKQMNSPCKTDKQIESRTATGRRRITPICVGSINDSPPVLVFNRPENSKTISTSPSSQPNIEKNHVTTDTNDNSAFSVCKLESLAKSSDKERPNEKQNSSSTQNLLSSPRKRKEKFFKNSHSNKLPKKRTEPLLENQALLNSTEGASKFEIGPRINPPNLQRKLFYKDKNFEVTVENNISQSQLLFHRIQYQRQGEVSWEHISTAPVLILEVSLDVIVLGLEDQTILTLSHSGLRNAPSFLLDALPSRIAVNNLLILVITSAASVYVWDLSKNKCLLNSSSIANLFESEVTLANIEIRNRAPVISLSSNKCYTFSYDYESWVLLLDKSETSCFKSGLFSRLNGSLSEISSKLPGSSNTSSNQQSMFVNSQSQMFQFSAFTLASSQEYRHWFLVNIRSLVANGREAALREICNELLGPVVKTMVDTEKEVLGICKKELLRDALACIATNLSLQRLFTEFNDLMSTVT